MAHCNQCCAKTDYSQPILPAEACNTLLVLCQELARLGGEASFLRRTEARLKSNLGFAEDRTTELQREVSILRQQVASYEASEHEAQVLEDVQRSVSRESSAGGNIAARMNGEPIRTPDFDCGSRSADKMFGVSQHHQQMVLQLLCLCTVSICCCPQDQQRCRFVYLPESFAR